MSNPPLDEATAIDIARKYARSVIDNADGFEVSAEYEAPEWMVYFENPRADALGASHHFGVSVNAFTRETTLFRGR